MIAALLAAALTQATQWPLGVEREVDEGIYMQVVAQEQGWRVWRIETAEGVDCRAYKSAEGRRHPVPVGVGSMMDRAGTPYLEVRFVDVDWQPSLSRFSAEWGATHYGRVRGKYRTPGDRFWDENDPDPAAVAEGVVEVVLESWEYPELMIGLSEQRASLDFTGIGWAQDAITSCRTVE